MSKSIVVLRYNTMSDNRCLGDQGVNTIRPISRYKFCRNNIVVSMVTPLVANLILGSKTFFIKLIMRITVRPENTYVFLDSVC